MCNMEIRIEMTKCNLKQWQVANLLNMSESAFSRMIRKELPEAEQEKIISIIEQNRG
ncbi:MAG: hypothetical protein ACI4EU_04310 [Butyrivibrio sp.]